MSTQLDSLRVLVVEDEALIALDLEDMLARLGCRIVASAAGVPEALRELRRTTPDVLVLDFNLRGRPATPVAQAAAAAGVPCLLTTAYSREDLPDAVKDATVLSKPYNQGRLAEGLRTVLRNGIERRTLRRLRWPPKQLLADGRRTAEVWRRYG